jgi:hypothetical protein
MNRSQWEVVNADDDTVMSAESVDAAAKRERTTPRKIAEREARWLVNEAEGDAPVFARKVQP